MNASYLLCSVAMRQHSKQEREWSEYVDRQFTRSASARLPCSRAEYRDDDDQEAFRRRNSTDPNRDPNVKSQQVSEVTITNKSISLKFDYEGHI